jgi:membrane peptidoglycan carboxypeptidase
MVSKERMLEIYLNIIEWGPDVYGIKEAAHYYFNKKPEQLSLNECIFLAGIIPNPKNFRYAFDKEGNLRNYFQTFFRVVSERLLMKEKITEAEFLTVNPHLKLTGPAAQWIMPADTLPDFDTKAPEEEEE